ncbi:MlaD family protein [Dysgonomonas sp. 25]|uniref:MlaD family protein n=1 Tax=Dysgonomonas sp. 25 TaxID=2302933 RepID=UPI0013D1F8C3|nr:MlaD family protein [Dysgonomonas sp. 25]NDV68166.1 MCE family protein [Dysgonomonas sp. 25]
MEKGSKEIKIGIAFILSIFLLYFGISFLKGINIFSPSHSYILVFDDVSGLTKSAPVTLNGLQVGQVYAIKMDPNNPKRAVVVINMNDEINIPVGSKFEMDNPMLGSTYIALDLNLSESRYIEATDTIVGLRQKGTMASANEMIPQFSSLIPKLDSILTGLQYLTNHPGLDNSISNVNEITSSLNKSTKDLNDLLEALGKDVPVITNNLASVSNDMKSMDIKSTYQSIDSTVKNIQYLTDRLNSKDGTVGLLLNDRQLYDSLNTTLNNASLLLKDVKENPSRYINVKVF